MAEGAAAGSVYVSVEYPEQRSWDNQWHELQVKLRDPGTLFAPGNWRGNAAVEAALKGFFIACFHLHEHIGEDRPVAGRETPQVRDFNGDDPVLRYSQRFANTAKDHPRRSGMTAGVCKVSDTPTGTVTMIKWMKEQDGDGIPDALDLARKCVAA